MAAAQNTYIRYGNVAMTLHWIIAALIIANLTLGLWFAEFMVRGDPLRFPVVQLHKSIGLTVLVFSVLRLAWRLVNTVPALPLGMSRPMRIVAHGTHFLFYFLIIALPLTGWGMASASPLGNPTMFFGLFPWPNIGFLAALPRADKRMYDDLFGSAHTIMAYITIALLILHVGAALYHHYLRRDEVLKRMVPGTDVTGEASV
jgi:cytochrome b561